MNRFLLCAAASALGFGAAYTASAADMAARGPDRSPAAYVSQNWTGFYIGLHAGWGWTDGTATIANVNTVAPGASGNPVAFDVSSKGPALGGQVGYNFQLGSNWVIGIEGDMSGTHMRGAASGPITIGAPPGPFGTAAAAQDVDWLASLRGRIGYTWGPGMIYLTGGGAWTGLSHSGNYTTLAGPPASSLTTTRTEAGWVIGGGYEHLFAQNWTARLEYLYYTFDGAVFTPPSLFAVAGLTPTYTTPDLDIHVVRMGLNYKF
jgi:outer membrane immunogenic protein